MGKLCKLEQGINIHRLVFAAFGCVCVSRAEIVEPETTNLLALVGSRAFRWV